MKKETKRWAWSFGILFIIILVFNFSSNIFSKENLDEESKDNFTNERIQVIEINDKFSNISEVHWTHMPITYKFENGCVERQISLTKLAFISISNETSFLIYFREVSESPDILIHCKSREWVKDASKITLGEASSNTSDYNKGLITNSEIIFYSGGMTCNTGYPALEVHEILHTFGLRDIGNLDKIMSGYSAESSAKCKIKFIDTETLSCLKYIYSNGTIQGNCSRVLFKVCDKGYVLGKDNKCHEECGKGYYCLDSTCCNNECFTCSSDSYLGEDCECHEY